MPIDILKRCHKLETNNEILDCTPSWSNALITKSSLINLQTPQRVSPHLRYT